MFLSEVDFFFYILELLIYIQFLNSTFVIGCCGFMTFWFGSGSSDPCLWLMDSDPDPSVFIIVFSDANKQLIKKKISAYYFLKVLLHHFSKIKGQEEVTKQ